MAGELVQMAKQGARPDEIEKFLDGLDDHERVEQIYRMSAGPQRRLWEICGSAPDLSLDVFAPSTDQRIIYRGRNSLPAFTHFEKHFWRPSDGKENFGINHQPMSWITGPGYFVFREEGGMILFDYTKVPSHQIGGWPKIVGNDTGVGPRVVYGNMIDYNRRVSRSTVIGEAHKKGKSINQFYMITRVSS